MRRALEDHPDPEDLSGAGPGRPGHDRAHPAPPDRRPHGRRAGRRGAEDPAGRGRRLEGPVHRPGEPRGDLREADDGRHPARRDPDGPRAARVRHDHHRRGPRAVPQHRLPARLPGPAPAQAPRPQGRDHLRDHRPGALLPSLRGRPDRRGQRAHVSRRGPLPPLLEEDSEESDRDQITAICDAVDELQGEGPGDILVFLSGEREIRDTADALLKRKLRNTEVLPSTRACRTPSSTASSRPTPAAGSSSPPTSPRRP